MGLSIGIVGLPNVGKSTLFNAITRAGAEAANYPFCTIDPNVGVVDVPDPRLGALAQMYNPKKVIPTAVVFTDIAGLVRGAAKGEGLGNKFLHHIREVDAIAHVVRCFADPDVTHVEGGVNPLRDMETINLELILADLDAVERQLERHQRAAKSGDKVAQATIRALERIKAAFEAEQPARSVDLTDDEAKLVQPLHLLTMKPVMYVANLDESEVATPEGNPHFRTVQETARAEGAAVVPVCAKIEAELAELDGEERAEFLQELGIPEAGLDRVIRTGYHLLGLITFLTAGEQEVRAWTIHRGTKAPQAAGTIHSDFERGFIRAEVVSFDDLVGSGCMAAAREKGLVRLEGKEYVMKDGDVTHFRFNV